MGGQQVAEQLRTRAGMTIIISALAIVQILLYLPTLKYQFVWDDRVLIVENRLLGKVKAWEIFQQPFPSGTGLTERSGYSVHYRPVTTLSYWLDLKLMGLNPAYFHLVNVVLAAVSTVLVVLMVWELLHSGVWALLAGLLFATHPAHVESIAFISARTDLLLTVFITGAGFALLRSFRKKDRRWWGLVPPLFILGLLSKETAILFPLLAGLMPILIQSRPPKGYWMLVTSLFVLAGGYLYLRYPVLNLVIPLPETLSTRDMSNVINTVGSYIRMFFWPFDHHVKIPADKLFYQPQAYFLYALVFFFSIPLAALRPRFRIALLGYVWTFIFLIPVSNLISLGPEVAERLLYPGSAGLIAVVVIVLSRLLVAHTQIRQVAGIIMLVVACVFGWDSFRRMPVWENELNLFSAMVREAPGAPVAYLNLAGVLSPSNPDSAIKLLNRAIILDQGLVEAHINIAGLYSRKGDMRRMFHHLRLAEELEPNSARLHNHYGYGYLFAGQVDSGIARFEQALKIDPGLGSAVLGLGIGMGLSDRTEKAGEILGRLEQADPSYRDTAQRIISELCRARSADTATVNREQSAVFINHLGRLLAVLGDTVQAEACYQRALEFNRGCVPALYNLALLMLNRGDTIRARNYMQQAVQLQPDLKRLNSLKPPKE